MSHNPKTSLAARMVGVNAQLALCNGGTLTVYAGTEPETVEQSGSGDVLVTIRLPSPAFSPAAPDGTDVVAKSKPIEPVTISTDGKAGWFRVYQKDGTTGVWQGTCGKGSGADMSFPGPPTLVSGAQLTIGSIAYRLPMA